MTRVCWRRREQLRGARAWSGFRFSIFFQMGFFQVPGFLWLICDDFPIFFQLTCLPACVEGVCFFCLFFFRGILVGNGIYIYIYICVYIYIYILVSFFLVPFSGLSNPGFESMQVIETINQWLVHHDNKQKTVFLGLHWPNICVLAGGLEHVFFP